MKYEQLDHSLKRAWEIARVGGHSMHMFTNHPAAIRYIQDARPLLHDVSQVFNPYDADLIIEVSPPDYAAYVKAQRTAESYNDSFTRIVDAGQLPLGAVEFEYTPTFDAFLKVAQSRLELRADQLDKIQKVAISIARLSLSRKVLIEHLSEAVHYQAFDREEILALDYKDTYIDIPAETTIDALERIRQYLQSREGHSLKKFHFGDSTIVLSGLQNAYALGIGVEIGKLLNENK